MKEPKRAKGRPKAKIKVAKVPRKRATKKRGKQEEMVDACDFCKGKLDCGRVRTIGSYIMAKSGVGPGKTYPLYHKNKHWFFCTEDCRNYFLDENSTTNKHAV